MARPKASSTGEGSRCDYTPGAHRTHATSLTIPTRRGRVALAGAEWGDMSTDETPEPDALEAPPEVDALTFDGKPATPVVDPRAAAIAEEAREEVARAMEAAGEPAVTVRQAARALGLTREHVYARIRAGSIRAIDGPGPKGGTMRLVPIAEIERLRVETPPRPHGEVKPAPADNRPILQLERVTQRLESTRAVLADAVEAIEEPAAGGWWGRRQRERERMARLEAALRAAHAAADAGASGGDEGQPEG